MIKPHWNIVYFINKLKYALLKRKYKNCPWFVFKAIDYLDKNITENSVIFEWGSGRSSIWFASKSKYVYSVEHNKDWFMKIQQIAKSLNLNLQIQNITEGELYENSIDKFPNSSFDFIIVDGIRRSECTIKAIKKLKPGGHLIIDNVERYLPSNSISYEAIKNWNESKDYKWKEISNILEKYQKNWYSNGIFDTAIFIKPQ